MNIVEIRAGDEVFGIDGSKIYKIIDKTSITPLVLVDKAIDGVSSVDGKIVVVVNFNRLVSKDEENLSKFVIVEVNEALYALRVKEIRNIVEIDEYEEIENDEIIGVYKDEEEVIQIIDLDKLLLKIKNYSFAPIEVESENSSKDFKTSKSKPYLVFKAKKELYAIEAEYLKEIMFANLKITPLANSDVGIINVRDKAIKVLEFNKLINEDTNKSIQNRILILSSNNKEMGLYIDEVIDIKDLFLDKFEKIEDEKINSIYKDEEIIAILDNEYIQTLIDKYYTLDEEKEIKVEEMREIVSFKISNETYAFDIDRVEEIVEVRDFTPMPEAKEYIKGVINLRGDVIVVISLPIRLGFDEIITKQSKIIIVNFNNKKVGLLVDEIDDVKSIKESEINKSNDGIIKEIANIDNGKEIILILDLENIIDEEDLKENK